MMNKFITRLLLFLLPIFAMVLYAEIKLATIANSYTTRRANLERNLEKITTLVVGSSHTFWGVDPAQFTEFGFNLGHAHQSVYYDAALTLSYLDRLPNLKHLIFPVSYFTFYYSLSDSPENWREMFYRKFWDIKRSTPKFDLGSFSNIHLYSLSKSARYPLKNFDVNLAEDISELGYKKMHYRPHFQPNEKVAKRKVEYYNHYYYRYNRSAEILANIDSLFTRLREREVTIHLVTTPAMEAHYKYYDPDILRSNEELIRAVCEKYGCGYFDYLRDSRFSVGDFIDEDHLNEFGAEKFSKMLDAEVLSDSGK